MRPAQCVLVEICVRGIGRRLHDRLVDARAGTSTQATTASGSESQSICLRSEPSSSAIGAGDDVTPPSSTMALSHVASSAGCQRDARQAARGQNPAVLSHFSLLSVGRGESDRPAPDS